MGRPTVFVFAALFLAGCSQSPLLTDIKDEVSQAGSTVDAPVFSPAGGNFASPPMVTLPNFPAGGRVIFTNNGSDPVYSPQGQTKDSTFTSTTDEVWLGTQWGIATLKALYWNNNHFSPVSQVTYRIVGTGGVKAAWAGAGAPPGQITTVATAPDQAVFGGGSTAGMAFVAQYLSGGTLGPFAVVQGGPGTVTGTAVIDVTTTSARKLLVAVGNLTGASLTYTFGNGKTLTTGPAGASFIAVYDRTTMTCQDLLGTTSRAAVSFTGVALSPSFAYVTGNFTGPGTASVGTAPVTLPRTGSNGVLMMFLYTSSLYCMSGATSATDSGTDWFNAVALDPNSGLAGVVGGFSPSAGGMVYGTTTLQGTSTGIKNPLVVSCSASAAFQSALNPAGTPQADGELLAAVFDNSGNLVAGGYQTGSVSAWNSYLFLGPGKNAVAAWFGQAAYPGRVTGPSGFQSGNSWVSGLVFDPNRNSITAVGTLGAGTTNWEMFILPSITTPEPFIAQLNPFNTQGTVNWVRIPDSSGKGLVYSAVGTPVADLSNPNQLIFPVVGNALGGADLSLGSGYTVTPGNPGQNPFLAWVFD